MFSAAKLAKNSRTAKPPPRPPEKSHPDPHCPINFGLDHTVMGSRTECTEPRSHCWRKLSHRGAEDTEASGRRAENLFGKLARKLTQRRGVAAAVDGGKPWKGVVVVNRGAAAPGHASPHRRTPEGWCCAPTRHKVALPGLMSLSGWPGAGAPRLTTTAPLPGLNSLLAHTCELLCGLSASA